MIPLFAPVRQNLPLAEQIEAKFAEILRSGHYILGREVEEFEKSLARVTGFKHAVGCSSGTEALVLALRTMGLSSGDEVITPAYSFVASTNAIAWVGARPVFADVDLETGNVTVETVMQAWTPRTRGVIAVDLFGRQAPIRELRRFCDEKGLFLIEDGAQSIGVPSRGAHFFTTSFYPTKNVGAMGDAGAVLTDDPELASRVKELSWHGGLTRDHYDRVGTNGRLDAIQAALLRLKLPKLEAWTKLRRTVAGIYSQRLKSAENEGGIWLPKEPQGDEAHVWALYTIRVPSERDAFAAELKAKGVGCGVYYPISINRQPAFQKYSPAACPNSERLAREALSIPLYPELSGKEIEWVTRVVGECASSRTSRGHGRTMGIGEEPKRYPSHEGLL